MKKILLILLTTFCLSILYSCDTTIDKIIQQGLNQANAELPLMMEEGIICDNITLGENGIVYHYTVDEDLYDMDILKSMVGELKQETIQNYKEDMYDDNETKEFLQAAADLNKPLNHKYEGNITGTIVRYKISVSELKSILGKY